MVQLVIVWPVCFRTLAADSSGDNAAAHRSRQARKQRRQRQQLPAARAGKPVVVGADGEEDWNLWASAELEQKLLDEVHTTGGLPGWSPCWLLALACCLGRA